MTISKKLLIATVFALGIQHTVPMYSYATYHAAELKTEIAYILDFIQDLHCYGTQEAKKAAKWLEKRITKKDMLSDTDIIVIAKAIASPTTINSKIPVILAKMAEKSENQLKQEKDNLKHINKWHRFQLKERAMVGAAAGACVMFAAWALYDDISRWLTYEIRKHDQSLFSKIDTMITDRLNECNQAYLKDGQQS